MIRKPQDLTREIEYSEKRRFVSAFVSGAGIATSAIGSFGIKLNSDNNLGERAHIAMELINASSVTGGAIMAITGLAASIRWGNRKNTLEATQAELILSETVPAERFIIGSEVAETQLPTTNQT